MQSRLDHVLLVISLTELLNKVWGLEGSLPIFTRCVRIVLSDSALAGLPCCWVGVKIRCRLTRQLVCGCPFKGQPLFT